MIPDLLERRFTRIGARLREATEAATDAATSAFSIFLCDSWSTGGGVVGGMAIAEDWRFTGTIDPQIDINIAMNEVWPGWASILRLTAQQGRAGSHGLPEGEAQEVMIAEGGPGDDGLSGEGDAGSHDRSHAGPTSPPGQRG